LAPGLRYALSPGVLARAERATRHAKHGASRRLKRFIHALDSQLAASILHEDPTAEASLGLPQKKLAKLRYDGVHIVGDELAKWGSESIRCGIDLIGAEEASEDARAWFTHADAGSWKVIGAVSPGHPAGGS
jgi:hypothetical protein